MMKKFLHPLMLLTVFGNWLLLWWSVAFLSIGVPPSISDHGTLSERLGWYQLAGVFDNSFHMWRVDPLLNLLGRIFEAPSPGAGMALPTLHLSIFMLGGIFLLRVTNPKLSQYSAALASGVLTLLILWLFGVDSVVIGSITWLPILTWAIRSAATTQHRKGVLALVVFAVSCRVAVSANQLSPFIIGIALLLGLFGKLSPQLTNYGKFLVVISMFPALFVMCSAPAPSFPDYPITANVVAEDGVPGFTRPFVGASPTIPFINRASLRSTWAWPAVAGLFASLIILASTRGKGLARFSTVIFLLLTLDTVFAESVARISPLQVATRLLPGLSFLSLTPIFSALGLIAVAVAAIESLGVSLLALMTLSALNLWSSVQAFPGRYIETKQDDEIRSQLSIENLKRHPAIISPSLNVLIKTHFFSLGREEEIRHINTIPLRETPLELNASANNNPRELRKMFDGRAETRWLPRTGPQNGTEFVTLKGVTQFPIEGVELRSGNFETDFPRGIRIVGTDSCELPTKENGITLFDAPIWYGSLTLTDENYPYFGGKDTVRAVFTAEAKFPCVVIFQTGTDQMFDWSVAEISVLKSN